MSSVLTFSSRAAQIYGATSIGLLNLDRWSLIFVCLQYKICFMAPPFRRLELWRGCWIFGKFVEPFFKSTKLAYDVYSASFRIRENTLRRHYKHRLMPRRAKIFVNCQNESAAVTLGFKALLTGSAQMVERRK